MPDRIQLRRTRGWRKPEGTIVVSRPSKWGNPFMLGEPVRPELIPYLVDWVDPNRERLLASLASLDKVMLRSVDQAVDAHARWIIEQPHLMASLGELRGHDLACWCPLDKPCHAETLLLLAN